MRAWRKTRVNYAVVVRGLIIIMIIIIVIIVIIG